MTVHEQLEAVIAARDAKMNLHYHPITPEELVGLPNPEEPVLGEDAADLQEGAAFAAAMILAESWSECVNDNSSRPTMDVLREMLPDIEVTIDHLLSWKLAVETFIAKEELTMNQHSYEVDMKRLVDLRQTLQVTVTVTVPEGMDPDGAEAKGLARGAARTMAENMEWRDDWSSSDVAENGLSLVERITKKDS